MGTDHPYVDISEGTVTCPVCGRVGGVGLPRHATIEAVTEIPPSGSDDGSDRDHKGKKCRPQRCNGGHSFEICFIC